MQQDRNADRGAIQAPPQAPIDGMLYNGVDPSAQHRAHRRALTTARQAAERRHARPSAESGASAAEFRAELARINALHRTWLLEHGEVVVERRMRRRKPSGTAL